MLRVLILHGWQGSAGPHWQRWLAPRLREDGCPVQFPELPNALLPSLAEWRAAAADELALLADAPGERVVVAHSLGCILWLHLAAARPARQPPVDRVLLNAPPGPVLELPTFFPAPIDAEAVAAAAGATRVVCSDNDPYCPTGAARMYAEPLGVPCDILPGQGHLNVDAGYGPWPAMLAWCKGERADVSAR